MQWWQAIILGVIEGATEFLPISSTFHLLFSERLLGISRTEFSDLFAVVIQMATMIPLVIIFGREWFNNRRWLLLTAAAFVPTAIVGFVGYKLIKNTFFGAQEAMLAVFILVGVFFFLLEWWISRRHKKLDRAIDHITYQEAVLIGLAQSLAVFPGVSRAGGVIMAMLLLGFKRDTAARFSFMLAVPTLTAAGMYDLFKMREVVVSSGNYAGLLVLGAAAALISAWLVIEWFLAFVRKRDFKFFGWYRVIVGACLLLWFLV